MIINHQRSPSSTHSHSHRHPSRAALQPTRPIVPRPPSSDPDTLSVDSDPDPASDDSDDIPLGQRHPDALKAQAVLRQQRSKRRLSRQAAKLNTTTTHELDPTSNRTHPPPLNTTTAHQAQDHRPSLEHPLSAHQLARAATIAKLVMRSPSNLADEEDNQPLGVLKRFKSIVRPNDSNPQQQQQQQQQFIPLSLPLHPKLTPPHHHQLSSTHPHTPPTDILIKKLERVKLYDLKPSVLVDHQLASRVDHIHPIVTSSLTILPDSQSQPSKTSHDPIVAPPSPHVHDVRPQLSRKTSSRQPHSSQNLITPTLPLEPEAKCDSRTIAQESRPAGLKRGPSTVETTMAPPQLHSIDTLGSNNPYKRQASDYHQLDQASSSLRRGKSINDKTSSSHSSHHPPPMIPSPAMNSSNPSPLHHHPQRLPQQPPQQLKPRSILNSPVKRSPKLPLCLDTKSLEPPFATSIVHSPIESPSLRTKILIKVAIVDQSRSIMVEIDQDTRVKDLLKEAESIGELNDDESQGSWGVFEVWKDLGIERPVREIESIVSIVDTWTSTDTNETHLLIQKNDLSGLAISKRSITSGIYGSNLWCELKPGKWTKKYVLLRDNGIYLCSNDKGKDEMFLCTMSKFDVYAIPSWAHKNLKGVPRDYSFGLKSLNKLSFFETKTDFIHKFSCKDRLVRLEWIRRLYDARTYLIMSSHQRVEEDSLTAAINRPKLSDPGITLARSHTEIKPTGKLGRSRTVGANQGDARHRYNNKRVEEGKTNPESISISKDSSSSTTNGGGLSSTGLSRKPTLIQPISRNKFKQGTLLGDLGTKQAEENHGMTSTLHPVLPSHIMSLTTSSDASCTTPVGLTFPPSAHQQDSKSNSPAVPNTIKVRTWEQMGPDERKLYLNEVQNRAKLEGRTLLQFEPTSPPPPLPTTTHHEPLIGGLLAGVQPSSSSTVSSSLKRNKTLTGNTGGNFKSVGRSATVTTARSPNPKLRSDRHA